MKYDVHESFAFGVGYSGSCGFWSFQLNTLEGSSRSGDQVIRFVCLCWGSSFWTKTRALLLLNDVLQSQCHGFFRCFIKRSLARLKRSILNASTAYSKWPHSIPGRPPKWLLFPYPQHEDTPVAYNSALCVCQGVLYNIVLPFDKSLTADLESRVGITKVHLMFKLRLGRGWNKIRQLCNAFVAFTN